MPRQRHIAVLAAAVAVAVVIGAITIPALSGAKGEPPQAANPTPLHTIIAFGTGASRVRADRDDRQLRIARAVGAAHARAVAIAVRAARGEALLLARSAGLTLGPIVSVDQTRQQLYGYSPYPVGRFGPGRYCGTIHRRATTSSGQRTTSKRYTCVAPERDFATLAVTFALR